MKSTWLRALILSLGLGGLFPLVYGSVTCVSVNYRTPMDPAKFHAMPYEQQRKWLDDNEVRVTGLECINERVRSRHFWGEYLPFTAYLIGLVFLGCLLMARWERSAPRSNSVVESDARQEAPRAPHHER